MVLDEEAKATQEIAKVAGKITDAARETGGFIARYIGGSLEQGIGIFEDKLKYMRWERQVRLMQRADEFLRERGLEGPTRLVPMKIAIPLLQAASLEEDDDLQDIWARLLVNAADAGSGVEVKRAYISILEDFDPLEAKILQKNYSAPEKIRRFDGIYTRDLPDAIITEEIRGELEDKLPRHEVRLALRNLARLGCLETSLLWGGSSESSVYITQLGEGLIEACNKRES